MPHVAEASLELLILCLHVPSAELVEMHQPALLWAWLSSSYPPANEEWIEAPTFLPLGW